MKVLVGYSDDARSRQALALGAMLAGGGPLVVCAVTPERWGYPSMARVDAEYESFLRDHARALLDGARAVLGNRPYTDYVTQPAGSVTQGLIDAALHHGAALIAVGGSREASLATFFTGHVTNELLHCAPLPVAVPPPGWQPAATLARLNVAFSGDPRASGTVQRVAAIAQAESLPLRILTMVVRDQQMFPSRIGLHTENIVSNQWREQAAAAQQEVRASLPADAAVSCALGDGASWSEALASVDWQDGDVLVLGSSPLSLVERVFLGSNARRILHAAPVPVIVVPRAAITNG